MPNNPRAETLLAAIRTLKVEPTGRSLSPWLEQLDQRDKGVLIQCMSAAHDVIAGLKDPRCNALTLDESATFLYLTRGGFQKRLRENQPWPADMKREEKPASSKAVARPLFRRDPLKAWDEASRERRAGITQLVQHHVQGFTTLRGAVADRMPWFVNAQRQVVDSAVLPLVEPAVLAQAMEQGGGIEVMSLQGAVSGGAWSPESSNAHYLWIEVFNGLLGEAERAAGIAWSKTRDPARYGLAPSSSDRMRSRS